MDTPLRKPLADLSPEEMQERAHDYRVMAATASTWDVRDALLRVAARLDWQAEQKRLGA